MYKACAICGKIHASNIQCKNPRVYANTEERQLRNKYSWQQKSLEIREKANYLCEVCRDREKRYTYDNIEVHHIKKLKDAPHLLLDNNNLVCLCAEHHKQADNAEISADYLLRLAHRREGG